MKAVIYLGVARVAAEEVCNGKSRLKALLRRLGSLARACADTCTQAHAAWACVLTGAHKCMRLFQACATPASGSEALNEHGVPPVVINAVLRELLNFRSHHHLQGTMQNSLACLAVESPRVCSKHAFFH